MSHDYGSEHVAYLCDVAERLRGRRRSASLLWLATHPWALARAGAALRRIPSAPVRVTDSAEGERLDRFLRGGRGLPVWRFARAVLPLPSDPADYLRGRSRQAVRTNLNHARKAGLITSRELDAAQQEANVRELLAARGNVRMDSIEWLEQEHDLRPGVDDHYVVHGADGAVLGVAIVVSDRHTAYLNFLLTVDEQPVQGHARYALSAAVIQDLAGRGVETLVASRSVIAISPGLRYFQHRLGFEPRNVRILPAAGPTPAGSLVGSLNGIGAITVVAWLLESVS
jgi:hypothetical protein